MLKEATLPPFEQFLAEVARRKRAVKAADADLRGDEIRARCQTLRGFTQEAWPILEPMAQFVPNWHIDAICDHLEAISRGKLHPRLLINISPGSMKSLLVSVMWQAWEWGPFGRPETRWLATAYNDDPVKRDSRKCRDLIMSDWYQNLWPEVYLSRTGERSFGNTRTGVREGSSFKSLTSKRGDRVLLDDPHSTETAESDAERENTTRKFREGLLNRLNDQKRSAIVVIMQRLHADDISGVILAKEMNYVHLMLPAEFDPARKCVTPIFEDPRTVAGEVMDPARMPRDELETLKRDMGSYAYEGQYNQQPGSRAGVMFKRSWFSTVKAVPAYAALKVRSWDLAATIPDVGKDPDWTVGLKMSTDGRRWYVEHVERLRDRGDSIRRAIKNCATLDGHRCHIRVPKDPGQAGKDQSESLVAMLAGWRAHAVPESGDKQIRAEPLAAQCEAGNVVLVEGPWNEAFLDELCAFPGGKHDDQVDAASGAFNYLATMPKSGVVTDDMIERARRGG